LSPAASAPAPAPAREEAQLSGDTRLLGIFAERDGHGWALFRLPSGARLVANGQEIAQGAKLVDVRRDGITIRDAGGERRIALRGEPPPKAAPVATNVARASRNPACVPPAGFKGTVLRVNAELFQGIIAKPESWSALVQPDKGALAVRDDSGFVSMLAMKRGDRLLQANGVALSAPDDVVSAVLRPLAAQQQVRVIGSRDGQPREWLLLNAGTCPA
jgi:type II secretory pathway component PulC